MEAGSDIVASIENNPGSHFTLEAGRYQFQKSMVIPSNTVIEGQGEVVITWEDPTVTPLVVQESKGVELINLKFSFSPPESWQAPSDHLVYANRGSGPFAPAIVIVDSQEVLLDGLNVETCPSSPLEVRESSSISILNSTFSEGFNRGALEGSVTFSNLKSTQIRNCTFGALRHLRIEDRSSHIVFVDTTFGCGVRYRGRSREIKDLLFEGCDFLLNPGYPWLPFNKGSESVGPGITLVDCRAYRQGTDAVVSGVLMEEGAPYVMMPRSQRGRFDDRKLGYYKMKLVERHQTEIGRQGPTGIQDIPAKTGEAKHYLKNLYYLDQCKAEIKDM